MNAVFYMLICYAITWVSFLTGFEFIGQKIESSIKFEKFLWNSRIDKMQYPPFTWIMKLAEGRNPMLILLVIIINSSMVITEFLLGMLLVGPVFLIIQGFMVGALIAQADSKTQVFSVFVLIFELGSFAASCGLGIFLITGQLFFNQSIGGRLHDLYQSGILLIPFALLILNGVFEGTGSYLGIEGVPGIRAVKEKLYK